MRWNRGDMLKPARPVPKIAGLKCVGVDGYHAKGVPAREQATYWELAGQFRGGDLYSFAWDAKRSVWDIWRTEADWLATERNGTVARPDLVALGHGPDTFTTVKPAARPRAKRSERPAADTQHSAPRQAPTTSDGVTVDEIERRLRVLVARYEIPRSTLRVLDPSWGEVNA